MDLGKEEVEEKEGKEATLKDRRENIRKTLRMRTDNSCELVGL